MRLLDRIASRRSRTSNRSRRKGAIAVLAAIFMVVMLGMVAFSVDVGYIAKTQAELQRACDAAALAAAGALVNGNGCRDDSRTDLPGDEQCRRPRHRSVEHDREFRPVEHQQLLALRPAPRHRRRCK